MAIFIVCRSKPLDQLFRNLMEKNEVTAKVVPVSAVVERQNSLNKQKRYDLSHRLYLLQKNNSNYIPIKRVSPKRRFNPFDNLDLNIRNKIQSISRSTYAKYRHSHSHFAVYEVEQSIKKYHKRLFYRPSVLIIKLGKYIFLLAIRTKRRLFNAISRNPDST